MGLYADRVFPWLLERLEGPEIAELRERCVSGAEGKVLEIGLGTGRTLPFYDPRRVTSLAAVEPVAGMHRKARERIAAAPVPVEAIQQSGERLPFAGASFDSVVVTMTLCSVSSQEQVLGEMLRVLRPRGTYHFLEHVASDRPRVRRLQNVLNPVNRIIGCGCNLNRETAAAIENAGFRIDRMERITSKDMPGHAEIFPIILGVATRP